MPIILGILREKNMEMENIALAFYLIHFMKFMLRKYKNMIPLRRNTSLTTVMLLMLVAAFYEISSWANSLH